MTSSGISCKSDWFRSSDERDQPYTKLNDLILPPQACASPVLSRNGAYCDPISTKCCCGNSCTDRANYFAASTVLVPRLATTNANTSLQLSLPDSKSRPAPILIPPPTLSARDIDRVPTPLTARGDRKGHLCPYTRGPSPRIYPLSSCSHLRSRTNHNQSEDFSGRLERYRSTSPASASTLSPYSYSNNLKLKMHNDSLTTGRYPASPLSSRPLTTSTPISIQNPRRGNHGRQPSRGPQPNLGRYHPSNFHQANAPTALASSATFTLQAPQITYTRSPAPAQVESPRLLREKHREFIEKARQSSKLAASPSAIKPDAPRLDPLGSPHGAVTPLELEEAGDYFAVGGMENMTPIASPGSRSPRALSISSDDVQKPSKARKIDV